MIPLFHSLSALLAIAGLALLVYGKEAAPYPILAFLLFACALAAFFIAKDLEYRKSKD